MVNGKELNVVDASQLQLYRTALAFKYYTNSKLSKQNVNIVTGLLKQAFEKSSPSKNHVFQYKRIIFYKIITFSLCN
jgi:hypothetical protein